MASAEKYEFFFLVEEKYEFDLLFWFKKRWLSILTQEKIIELVGDSWSLDLESVGFDVFRFDSGI